ncbi:hypothetical protein E7Z59_09865 [Robertkochia marina]|uniref:Uncharacterized protein n=2 Tax=Robertkochia marina TaxID=1227945 RepID=A0A4V3UY67_9FLAO|nr:hypothetical protein E7Z59_09865 [Robertkochia marina]
MIPKIKNKELKGSPLIIGSLVALLIAISPYIFYLYESFPKANTWQTDFFYFTSEYELYTSAWLFLGKFVPLYLFIIWFITCKHWWYHVILIPISMFVFQLISVMNDLKYLDEVEIYFIIPVMMIVIPLVYLVRLKLFDKVVHGIDLRKIDEELERYDALEKELERESHLYQS